MKYVIDIDEKDYKKLSYNNRDATIYLDCSLREVIANATPLNQVLEEIKGEIKNACTDNYGMSKDISYEHIVYVINKHIEKECHGN